MTYMKVLEEVLIFFIICYKNKDYKDYKFGLISLQLTNNWTIVEHNIFVCKLVNKFGSGIENTKIWHSINSRHVIEIIEIKIRINNISLY